jgi:hypothetical protein
MKNSKFKVQRLGPARHKAKGIKLNALRSLALSFLL